MAIGLLILCSGRLVADDHGDSPLAATPVTATGELVEACIETAGDMDYFLFSAVSGRTYRLVTSHLSSEMDSVLYLFSSNGTTILTVDDDGGGGNASRVIWACVETGTYFAMVRHAQATSGTGCYGLSLSLEQLDDHGDSELAATPITYLGQPVSGFLESSDDTDVFLFDVTEGYRYTLSVTRTSDAGVAHVRLSDGEMVSGLAADVSSEPAGLQWTASEDSVVFALITATDGTESLGYEITVQREGYTDDHGNSPATATVVDSSLSGVTGVLDVSGDEDWFSFTAREGSEYGIAMSAQEAPLDVSLLASDGTTILWTSDVPLGDQQTLTWVAPSDGVYLMRIHGGGRGAYQISFSATLKLETLGSYNPQGYSLDVAAAGDLVYLVVGTKGLVIVDASDPSRPIEVGAHSTRGYAQAVGLSGTLAVVANRGEGITVIDVSDPARPVLAGASDTSGSAQDIAVVDGTVYVADQRGGLQIFETSSGETLTLLSSYETSGYAEAIALSAGVAYIAVGDAGLEMVDVRDPRNPVSLGSIDLRGDAGDVVVSGKLAYVASGFRGIRIVDVSDASQPVEVGSVSTDGEVLGLCLANGHLYAAERTEGLSVYSIADPLSPERIARIDTPGEALRVAVISNRAYVADREEGLQIIQLLP